MSQPQSSTPSSSPTSQTVLTRPPARVPRRFAAGTLMILIAAYGLIIRGLMATGMPTGAVVTIAGTLTAAGAAQVFLFRGERPRYASIIFGAVAAPICAGVYALINSEFAEALFIYQTIPEVIVTVYYFSVVGAILGYTSGCIAAGLFLMLGRIPWMRDGLDQAETSALSPAGLSDPPSVWQRFVSSISFNQPDRPLREFTAMACILLAVFIPLAVFMPWWRASVYLPIVSGIAIGIPFLRTGLRQLGGRLAAIFSLFSLLCAIGPAIVTAQIEWADGFVTELPVIGAVLLSFLTSIGLSAAIGWLRWIRRSYFNAQGATTEIVALTILIIVVNVGVSLCITLRLRQPDQIAVRRIHELNGSVSYTFPNQNLLEGRVQHIDLRRSRVRDDDLQLMTALTSVTHLDLSNSNITDAGIQHLQRFPQLNSLYLTSSHVTDVGVEQLGQLGSLSVLSLRDCKITASSVKSLQALNLQVLAISGPNLDASLINEVANLSTLVNFTVYRVDLNGADLSPLSRIPRLTSLALIGCNLSDEDLRGLVGLPTLEALLVSRNPITNECRKILPKMRSLRKVDLFETEVTQAGMNALESQMPTCVFLGQ